MEQTWLAGEQLVAQARANAIDNLLFVFADRLIKSIVERMVDAPDGHDVGLTTIIPMVWISCRCVGWVVRTVTTTASGLQP